MKGSVVLILDEQGRLLLLKRSMKSRWMPGKWGLPGGKIERGENAKGAAIRETKEETDLDLKAPDVKHIARYSNKTVDFFYAKSYTGEVRIDFEHDDFEWVARTDINYYDTVPDLIEKFDWILNNER